MLRFLFGVLYVVMRSFGVFEKSCRNVSPLTKAYRFLSSFIPRVVKIIQIQKNNRAFIVFQLTPNWLLKDALLRSY